MEQHFARTLDALDQVFAFIERFARSVEAGPTVVFQLNLAIEELFVNMVSYNPDSEDSICLTLQHVADQIIVLLQDTDSQQYDITQHETVDVNAPLEEREIGGLGIHLVKNLMDEVYYEYKDRKTTIRLTKNLPGSDAHH